jgi:hypothetical protein
MLCQSGEQRTAGQKPMRGEHILGYFGRGLASNSHLGRESSGFDAVRSSIPVEAGCNNQGIRAMRSIVFVELTRPIRTSAAILSMKFTSGFGGVLRASNRDVHFERGCIGSRITPRFHTSFVSAKANLARY